MLNVTIRGGESSSIGDIGINPITKYVDRLKPRQ